MYIQIYDFPVFYADEDTDNVSHSKPDILEQIFQEEANKSKAWVRDNKLVCSGSKIKLLIIGTKERRKSKLV